MSSPVKNNSFKHVFKVNTALFNFKEIIDFKYIWKGLEKEEKIDFVGFMPLKTESEDFWFFINMARQCLLAPKLTFLCVFLFFKKDKSVGVVLLDDIRKLSFKFIDFSQSNSIISFNRLNVELSMVHH